MPGIGPNAPPDLLEWRDKRNANLAETVQYPEEVVAAAMLEMRRREKARVQRLHDQRRDFLGFMEDHFNAAVWDGTNENHEGELYSPGIAELVRAVEQYPWVGVQSGNSTGKTHILPRLIWTFLKTYGTEVEGEPSCEVYVTAAPPARNLNRIWSELQTLMMRFENEFAGWAITQGNSDRRLHNTQRPGKWFCEAIPIPVNKTPEQQAEAFTGKHAKYMLFVLDDANSIPKPIWDAIEECTTAGVVTRVVFCYNPRQRNSEAFRRFHTPGLAYGIQLSAFEHPNVRTGRLVIPGAVSRPSVVDQVNKYSRSMAEGEPWDDNLCFELPEYLTGATVMDRDGSLTAPLAPGKRIVTDDVLLYRVLARAPKVGLFQLIPDEWIARARSNYDLYLARYGNVPPEGAMGRAGWDVAETVDTNVLTKRWGNFVKINPSWGQQEIADSEDQVALDLKIENIKLLFVDSNGLGAGIPGHMKRKGFNCVGIKVQEKPTRRAVEVLDGVTVEHEFNSLGDQLSWAVREWLNPEKNPGAMLPPHPDLLGVMPLLVYRKLDNGKIWVTNKDSLEQSRKLHSPDVWESFKLTFAPAAGAFAIAIQHAG